MSISTKRFVTSCLDEEGPLQGSVELRAHEALLVETLASMNTKGHHHRWWSREACQTVETFDTVPNRHTRWVHNLILPAPCPPPLS